MPVQIAISGPDDITHLRFLNRFFWKCQTGKFTRGLLLSATLSSSFLLLGLRYGYDLKTLYNSAQTVNYYSYSFWVGLGAALLFVTVYAGFNFLRTRKKRFAAFEGRLSKLNGRYRTILDEQYFFYENNISSRKIAWEGFESFMIADTYVILFRSRNECTNLEYIHTQSLNEEEKLNLGELLLAKLPQTASLSFFC